MIARVNRSTKQAELPLIRQGMPWRDAARLQARQYAESTGFWVIVVDARGKLVSEHNRPATVLC